MNNSLSIGQVLLIPEKESEEVEGEYKLYTVKSGDTLYKIANDNNIDADLLAQLNGINKSDYIYPNQTLILPKDGVVLYLTNDNDTITSVVDKYNIGLEDLVKNNKNIYLRGEQILVLSNK